MWAELYAGTAQEAAMALDDGPLILSGLPGSGRAPLIREVSPSELMIEIRARHAGTAGGLELDLLNALLDAWETVPEAATPRDFNRLVASAFGPRAQEVLRSVEQNDASGLSLPDILAALPADATLIVHDAHLLPRLSERALWALRARAQAPGSPRIALLTRTWERGTLVGPDAAFFGFGQAVDLHVPSLHEWSGVSPVRDQAELSWLLEQTRGVPRVTFAALERVDGASDLHAAWRAHVAGSARVASEVQRLAYAVHVYAPRLLTAIAAGERVYTSVPDARTDVIASALRGMRNHDIVYQPKPRTWIVSDPALEPHLAASRVP